MTGRAFTLVLLFTAIIGALATNPPPLVVLIIGTAALWVGWLYLCRRHPYVAIAIAGFLSDLLGRGRR